MVSGLTTTVAGRGLGAGRRSGSAFTLVELLVVIGIIGILAAIGLPALRGLGESNAMDAAIRQVLDDLAYARLRAINERTTVYMLFVPPNVEQQVTNLADLRLTGYTLFTRKAVGEQPGRSNPRQLIPWRSLPDKTFFSYAKFAAPSGIAVTNAFELPFAFTNNFQLTITNQVYQRMGMSYIAFNAQGQVVRYNANGRPVSGQDEYIPLVKGSIVHPQDGSGNYNGPPDIVETPRSNRRFIRLNWLTGRAEVLGDLHIVEGKPVLVGNPE